MKKFYFYIMMSLIMLTGCSNVTPTTNEKIDKKFVEVNSSKLGLENTTNNGELSMSYDANSEKEKEYRQLKEIEKNNEQYKDGGFEAFMRGQEETQDR